jgi:hypothetical protein
MVFWIKLIEFNEKRHQFTTMIKSTISHDATRVGKPLHFLRLSALTAFIWSLWVGSLTVGLFGLIPVVAGAQSTVAPDTMLQGAEATMPQDQSRLIQEPAVLEVYEIGGPYTEGFRRSYSVGIIANNYGFGLRGRYDKLLNPRWSLFSHVTLTGLRDVSEQTYTDIFFGTQVVPNKYKRGLSIPLQAGARYRLFADRIDESYRFFVSGAAGPVFAFTYPYFNDADGSGYRERFIDYFEQTNDALSGWGDGSWSVGAVSEFSIGLDFGEDLSRVGRVEFSVMMYYYPEAIQMMMPNQPALNEFAGPGDFPYLVDDSGALVYEPFFDSQSFFVTPMLSFSFGARR